MGKAVATTRLEELELIQLAQSRRSKFRRIWHIATSMLYVLAFVSLVCGVIIAEQKGNASLATGLSFVTAAAVVALQNFIASFITYVYINLTNQYDVGDIIKIGDPRMTSIGEVIELSAFSTTINELDDELLFTGRQFTLPNNVFFNAGVYNYTRNNLLFWNTTKTLVSMHPGISCDEMLDRYREIVYRTHQEMVKKYKKWYPERIHHPKYQYVITEKGIEIEARLSIHFYNVLEFNNLVVCRLVDAHRTGTITLVEHKDHKGAFNPMVVEEAVEEIY